MGRPISKTVAVVAVAVALATAGACGIVFALVPVNGSEEVVSLTPIVATPGPPASYSPQPPSPEPRIPDATPTVPPEDDALPSLRQVAPEGPVSLIPDDVSDDLSEIGGIGSSDSSGSIVDH